PLSAAARCSPAAAPSTAQAGPAHGVVGGAGEGVAAMERCEPSCCGHCLARAAFAATFLVASVPTWAYVAISDVCDALVSACTTRSEVSVGQEALAARRAHGAFVGRAISKSWQLALRVCCWLRVDASGLRPLEDAGGGERRLFICANHASYMDTVLICAYMPRHLVGEAKTLMARKHLGMPVLGRIANHVGHMPVPFTSSSRGNYAVDKAKMAELMANVDRCIEGGGHLAIFPEGDLNPEPDVLLPFRAGGMDICIRHDMEVWAWVMTGQADCWPVDAAIGGRPSSIQLRAERLHHSAREAAARLAGPGADAREQAIALAADLRARMQGMLDEMLGNRAPPVLGPSSSCPKTKL
ncbi:unnamed protein product, partial [Prorocentrum cordatum]